MAQKFSQRTAVHISAQQRTAHNSAQQRTAHSSEQQREQHGSHFRIFWRSHPRQGAEIKVPLFKHHHSAIHNQNAKEKAQRNVT